MLKKIFFYIAVAGWVLSLIIHLLTFVGYDILERTSLFLMFPLHFLVFMVWIPAMIYLMKSEEYRLFNPFYTLKAVYNRVPIWVTVICVICYIYVLVTFLVTWSFSEERGTTTGIFSSFWMLFYGVAAAILFPTEKQVENDL